MKKLSMLGILILVAMFSFNVKADIITLDGANEIANAFFANSASSQKRALKSAAQLEYAWDSNSLTQTGSSVMKSVEEDPTFYVFNNPDGEGFVIVSGDSNARSVIGYSYEGNISAASEIPDPMKDYLLGIDEEIKWARTNLTSGNSNLKATLDETGGTQKQYWETPSWGQGAPFNNLCPIVKDILDPEKNIVGEASTKTGCVPTAFASVMRFHKWPLQGKNPYATGGLAGSWYYDQYNGINATDARMETINHSAVTYDWDNMPMTYSSSWTEAQKTQVATLMRNVGYAFDAEFGIYSTNWTEGDVPPKVLNSFDYTCDGFITGQFNEGTDKSIDEWLLTIKGSLDNGFPIPYAANNSGTGDSRHMFVVDGYTSNNYFHFNFGWGGSGNGWFLITAVTPSAGDNYSWKTGAKHRAYINFRPNKKTTISVAVDGTGSVTIDGSSVTSKEVEAGTQVTLQATGDNFAGWVVDGTIVSTANPYIFTASATKTYTAKFAQTYPLRVQATLDFDKQDTNNTVTQSAENVYIGAKVDLTATPARGYAFDGWNFLSTESLDYVCKSTDLEYTATIEDNPLYATLDYIPVFAKFSQLTPASFTVTTADANMGTATWSFQGAQGDVYAGEEITLTATPKSGYMFSGWSDGTSTISNSKTCTVAVENGKTYTANFALAGADYIVESSTGTYTDLKSSRATAWTYTTTQTNPVKLQLTATNGSTPIRAIHSSNYLYNSGYDVNATQSYTPITFTLSVPEGQKITRYEITYTISGAVTISNGQTTTNEAQTLIWTATEDVQSTSFTLSGTSGGYIKISNFIVSVLSTGEGPVTPPAIPQYTATVSTNGTGGTATVNGQQSVTVDSGTEVTFVAIPANGYRFTGWSSGTNSVSDQATYTVNISADMNLMANFEAASATQYTATAVASPTEGGTATVAVEGTGTGSSSVKADKGTNVEFTAAPAEGYEFVNWTGTTISGENPLTLPLNADITLTANFREEQGGGEVEVAQLVRTNWSVTASSQEPAEAQWGGGGETRHAIDNSETTFWHSQWNASKPTVPHWIQFNLGGLYEISAINYVSRSSVTNQNNGQIKDYRLYISSSDISANINSTTYVPNGLEPVKDDVFTYGTTNHHNVTLESPVCGQYIYLLVDDSYNVDESGVKFANCAEFYAYGKQAYSVSVNATEGGTATVSATAIGVGGSVTFTATTNAGYNFLGWFNGETKVNDNPEFTQSVTSNLSLTAKFAKQTFTVSATPNGTNGTVTVSPNTSPVEYGADVTFTATANPGYRFVSWSNGETTNPYTVTVTENISLIANFEEIPTHSVNVSVNGNGSVEKSADSVLEGSTVILTATPAEGYRFTGWSIGAGEIISTANPYTVTVTENISLTANFEAIPTYTITVTASPAEGGTVTKSAESVLENGTVTITATANEGYTFTGWNDGSTETERTITVTGVIDLIANFESQGGDDDDDDIQYCTPSVTTQGTSDKYVGQIVTLTTTGAVENANWNNPHDTSINGYDPVKNTFSALPGQTITLNIVDKNTTWGCVRVYVDLNGNKTFDSGEQIFADASRNRTTPISQQFTLSSDIQPRSYLMRVMYVDADTTTLTKWACDSYTQGGYYDFYFNVPQPEDCTVSVASNDETMGTATISETDVQTGQTITLTATPVSNDYRFVNWTVGGEVVSTENPYSAIVTGDAEYVANFAVYAVEPKKFDRTGWTVTASSEETVGETAPDDYIIDNSTTTFWHSKWKNGEAGYPHWFMIDMKSVKSINAFDYVSRGTGTSDAGENNGNIKNYTLYVSETEINVNSLPSAAVSGTFSYPSASNVHNVELTTPVIGRYVMLYATGQSANGKVNAACADFQIYGKDVYSVSATATPQTGGTATVTPNKVAEGDVATFTATVNAGYKFLGWFNGDTKVSEDAEYAPRISGNLSLTAKFEEIPAITPVAASTDMVQYQRNHIDLIHDNNLTTKFYSSTAQQVGQYITLELGGLYEVEDIALYFASGDRPGAVKIEISTNGSDWNEVSTFNSSDIPAGEGASYGCTAEGAEARFVKMTITTPNGDKWLQLLEFKVYGTEVVDVPEYAVSVEPNNQGWGTVSIQGYDDTSISIEEGLRLTLLAEPEDDYLFVNWTVNDVEVSHEATFRTEPIFEATTYVANFKEKTRYNVTANATEGGTAEVSQSSVLPGNQVTFTATPADGYKFVNWTEGGVEVSTENPYTVTITAEKELTANFKAVSTDLLLSFAAISDLHAQQDLITNANNIQLRESVTKTLSKIKEEENVDLIVLGGDYTSNNAIPYTSWEKTRELLINATRGAFNGTKTPVIYVNGNHEYEVANYNNPPRGYNAGEYYGTPMKTDIGALAEEDDCFYEYAENGTGEAFKLLAAYHYVVKGFDFVVLNAGKKLFTSASNYSYSEESVEWCKEKLANIYADDANKTVFFLVHIPFSDSNRLNEGKGMASNDATTLLKSTLAKYPNLVMLYGHDHGGDKAYIRTSTNERVTEYATNGSVYTPGDATYYIQNYNTSKYLGYSGKNISNTENQTSDVTIKTSTYNGVEGAFNIYMTNAPKDDQDKPINYLHCGGSGRFSGNNANDAIGQQVYLFEVVDPNAAKITATQATSVVAGKTYMLVAYSEKAAGYYALTNEMYNNDGTNNQRMNGAAVTISEGTIEYTPGTASVLWTINKKPSATDKSFFSSFMGSMRYYNNTIEGTDQLAERNIVQALMVYVYSDRVELKMKNYAKSGEINGITVNKNLTPYVSERTVTHSEEAVTAQPVITSTGSEVSVGDEVTVTVDAPEWHNLYYTTDGTEPTEKSAKAEKGKITFTAQAGNNVIKVAAQEGIRLMSPVVSVTYTATTPLLTVTVSSADENMGSVTASATEVEYDDRVKVTATAKDGYYFVKWTDVNGNTISESFSYTFVVTESVELIAHFAPLASGERTIIAQSNDITKGVVYIALANQSGTGTGTGGTGTGGTGTGGTGAGGQRPSITTSEDVQVTAAVQLNSGCEFINWTIDGVVVSTDPVYIYTRKKSVTLQANFNFPEAQLPNGYPEVGTIMNYDCTTFTYESTKNADTHALHSLRAVSSYEGAGKEIEFKSVSSHTINDYTGTTINVKQGGTLTINFTVGIYTNNIWFGFDWNRDGKFDEVIAGFEGSKPSGTTEGSISVTIPEDALPGKSVMRIISDGIVCESAWNVTTPMAGTHGEGVVGYAGSLHDITMFVNNVIKSEVNLANIQAQEENVLVTTESPAEIVVGSKTYNTTEDNLTVTIPVSEGDVKIVARGANIVNVDCGNTLPSTHILPIKELVLRNTSAAEVAIDAPLLEKITVVSDENNNVAAVSVASDLSQGVQVVVEKTINTPQPVEGKGTPTIFNFLSMPFAFNTADIKYWDGDSWETADPEDEVRILLYDSQIRAEQDYENTWRTLQTSESETVAANQGFVIVGNNNLGTTVKLQFTSAEKAYNGSVSTIVAQNYGTDATHPYDTDWNINGVPYLTNGLIDGYTLYFHNGYGYEAVATDYALESEKVISAYQSVMYQANIESGTREIYITPSSVSRITKAADDVFARAYIAVDNAAPAKIILSDESSENFVVNEDAWYLAPTANAESAAYFNIGGSDAAVTVQPEATELPMTVYTGAGTQHRIALSATDGEYEVYLKDAVTDEIVCLNDEDYNFTAAAKTTIANRFTVSMVEPTGIIEQAKAEGVIKAVVTGDVIKLYGTEEGDEVTLYTTGGMVITNAVAEDGVTTIETSATGVLIIKVADQTVKVVK